ncbi:hypothetical protein FACS1894113_2700 [Alphaproteobacteria bacterium]|nr:hypothetical protein FACS1894113_2700 [Alphaproteobacteria bacterium]
MTDVDMNMSCFSAFEIGGRDGDLLKLLLNKMSHLNIKAICRNANYKYEKIIPKFIIAKRKTLSLATVMDSDIDGNEINIAIHNLLKDSLTRELFMKYTDIKNNILLCGKLWGNAIL